MLHPQRSQLRHLSLVLFSSIGNTADALSGEHEGKAHLYQVPEEHFPVLRAADHVGVMLTQAAVQLVLLVLMANVPSSGGGEAQRGLFHPEVG